MPVGDTFSPSAILAVTSAPRVHVCVDDEMVSRQYCTICCRFTLLHAAACKGSFCVRYTVNNGILRPLIHVGTLQQCRISTGGTMARCKRSSAARSQAAGNISAWCSRHSSKRLPWQAVRAGQPRKARATVAGSARKRKALPLALAPAPLGAPRITRRIYALKNSFHAFNAWHERGLVKVLR